MSGQKIIQGLQEALDHAKSGAPDRIWAAPWAISAGVPDWTEGEFWLVPDGLQYQTPYVRSDLHDALAAENARLRELVASPPIKPLVWEPFGKECVRADSVCGRWEIIWGFRGGQVWLEPAGGKASWHDTLEAAKAAAQSDYESRIRAALATPPSGVMA